MQEQPPYPPQPPAQNFAAQPMYGQPAVITRRSNTLGLVGFILSCIGMTFGWCLLPLALLSLIGMVLSGVAMFKPPRGLAIAGFIIGLIGTAVLAVLGAIIAIAFANAPTIQAGADAQLIRVAIQEHHRKNGAFPDSVADMTTIPPGATTDFWNNAYLIDIDPTDGSFTLRSVGEDGVEGTNDDITMDQLGPTVR